jgi:hypothetical protein
MTKGSLLEPGGHGTRRERRLLVRKFDILKPGEKDDDKEEDKDRQAPTTEPERNRRCGSTRLSGRDRMRHVPGGLILTGECLVFDPLAHRALLLNSFEEIARMPVVDSTVMRIVSRPAAGTVDGRPALPVEKGRGA